MSFPTVLCWLNKAYFVLESDDRIDHFSPSHGLFYACVGNILSPYLIFGSELPVELRGHAKIARNALKTVRPGIMMVHHASESSPILPRLLVLLSVLHVTLAYKVTRCGFNVSSPSTNTAAVAPNQTLANLSQSASHIAVVHFVQ